MGEPPYGYIKNPNDKKKWIVDEEAAEVVKSIFALIAGTNYTLLPVNALTTRRLLSLC